MRPIFFVENMMSSVQFPAHVLDASTEAGGFPAWRVGTGRRSRYDRWMPAGTNVDAWIRVDCAVARSATMIALDRGHNLAGKAVKLQGSATGADLSWVDVVSSTIPAAVSAGGDSDAANGVHTEEGAWLKSFPSASYRYWRLLVPAMGADLRPEVVGLWIGRSWSPLEYFDLPYSDAGLHLGGAESESDVGWLGLARPRRGRRGEIRLKLRSSAEYEDHARYHIEQQFWARRPMWIIFDPARSERAVLAVPRPGEYGLDVDEGWGPRQTVLQWSEHEPRLT